jgi:hypothetical protein
VPVMCGSLANVTVVEATTPFNTSGIVGVFT